MALAWEILAFACIAVAAAGFMGMMYRLFREDFPRKDNDND